MQNDEPKKFALILFSMLRSVGLFTVGAYGAVIIALLSGIPSLAPGSWQADLYPDLFRYLARGFFPAMIAMTLLGLGTASADETLAANLSPKRWKFWVYVAAISILLFIALYFIVYGFGYLQGYMETGIENAKQAVNASKK